MKKDRANNQNKQNKNQTIKSRKSISPFASSSLSDPMNSLQNTVLKEKRINMINNFLIINNYPYNFNKKDFASMSADFRPILKFIMEKLDPNVNLLESLTDDKIEALAKIYEYPGKLTRSMIREFNTPTNFLYILTFICYMANLVSYKEYFTEKEIKELDFYQNNMNQNNININNDNNFNDNQYLIEMSEFMNECLNSIADNNVSEILEKYKTKFNNLCSDELNKVDKMYAELDIIDKSNKDLGSNLPNIDVFKSQENETIQKFNYLDEEYTKSSNEIKEYNQKLEEINNYISEQEKKMVFLDNEIKNTRNIINTQIMSRAEYDIKQGENNKLLNQIKNVENEINGLNNTKNEIINSNQSLLNKMTILANDINNIDINNSKKIKNVDDGNNNNENDISILLNITNINKEVQNNIINNNDDKNIELLKMYDDYINRYESYIKDIKEEYTLNYNGNKELENNKELLSSEIEKYKAYLTNDNKIGNDRKDLIYKINNDYLKLKKEKSDYINSIKNEIKIYENNIEEKKKDSVKIENECIKLRKELDEYKNETSNNINTLIERYHNYYNNFIDTSYEITSKIINSNQTLNQICNNLQKIENKENLNFQNDNVKK
jgi:hypothetical protein